MAKWCVLLLLLTAPVATRAASLDDIQMQLDTIEDALEWQQFWSMINRPDDPEPAYPVEQEPAQVYPRLNSAEQQLRALMNDPKALAESIARAKAGPTYQLDEKTWQSVPVR
jgi:hypothetical protein